MTPHQAALKALQDGFVPDWEDCVKMIAAHLEQQGQTYVEIAVDPQTSEIAWSFTATPMLDESMQGKN